MLSSAPTLDLCVDLNKAHRTAVAYHGDLGLDPTDFLDHLTRTCQRQRPDNSSCDGPLVLSAHTNDLYLAAACSRGLEAAWRRFTTVYAEHIRKVAGRVCSSRDAADELASSIAGHIFLPDASGRSRIASYEGRKPLAAWIAVVVYHQGRKERERSSRLEFVDNLLEVPDTDALKRIESEIRSKEYSALINDAFLGALKNSTARDRLILSLKHRDGLEGSEIAELIRVHPSTVSRVLHRSYNQLRRDTISFLRRGNKLSTSSIEECIAKLRDEPSASILENIRLGLSN